MDDIESKIADALSMDLNTRESDFLVDLNFLIERYIKKGLSGAQVSAILHYKGVSLLPWSGELSEESKSTLGALQ